MSLKHWKLTKRNALILFLLLGFGSGTVCLSSDFQYFEKSLDYWNEHKAEKPNTSDESKTKVPVVTDSAQQTNAGTDKFPWKQYLDPKNREFFKEGDYTPPEPFMELARDPSDENMKMWFAYIEKKNELQAKLQERMAAYVAKKGLSVPPEQEKVLAKFNSPESKKIDSSRFRLRMYFSSTCPHCQKMMGTLSELQARGFFVETRQIDRTNSPVQLPFPTEMATESELKGKDIQSVPLLLIADLKKKAVYRITGFKTMTEILDAIKLQENGT